MSDQTSVFVGGLPPHVTEQMLRQLFESYGSMVSCNLMTDQRSMQQYGFVKFSTVRQAQAARQTLNGFDFHGCQLTVRLANPGEEAQGPSSSAGYGMAPSQGCQGGCGGGCAGGFGSEGSCGGGYASGCYGAGPADGMCQGQGQHMAPSPSPSGGCCGGQCYGVPGSPGGQCGCAGSPNGNAYNGTYAAGSYSQGGSTLTYAGNYASCGSSCGGGMCGDCSASGFGGASAPTSYNGGYPAGSYGQGGNSVTYAGACGSCGSGCGGGCCASGSSGPYMSGQGNYQGGQNSWRQSNGDSWTDSGTGMGSGPSSPGGSNCMQLAGSPLGMPQSMDSPPPSDNLYIKGLPANSTDQLLRDVLGAYGAVTSTRILETHGRSAKGDGKSADGESVALVRMGSIEEATWLVENLNGNIPQGLSGPVLVRFADPPGMKIQKQYRGENQGFPPTSGGGKGGKDEDSAWAAAPTGVASNSMMNFGGPPAQATNLYVKDLPPSANDLYLYKVFAPFGAIQSVRAMQLSDNVSCSGIGFIKFTYAGDAQKAIQSLNMKPLQDGSILKVSIKTERKGGGKGDQMEENGRMERMGSRGKGCRGKDGGKDGKK